MKLEFQIDRVSLGCRNCYVRYPLVNLWSNDTSLLCYFKSAGKKDNAINLAKHPEVNLLEFYKIPACPRFLVVLVCICLCLSSHSLNVSYRRTPHPYVV